MCKKNFRGALQNICPRAPISHVTRLVAHMVKPTTCDRKVLCSTAVSVSLLRSNFVDTLCSATKLYIIDTGELQVTEDPNIQTL